MACTVAVEESIAHHYNNQIRTLMEEDPEKHAELLQVCGCTVDGLIKGQGHTCGLERRKTECEGP